MRLTQFNSLNFNSLNAVKHNAKFSAQVCLDKMPEGYKEPDLKDAKTVNHGSNILRMVNKILKNEQDYQIYTKNQTFIWNPDKSARLLGGIFVFKPFKNNSLPVLEYKVELANYKNSQTERINVITPEGMQYKCELWRSDTSRQVNQMTQDNKFSEIEACNAFDKLNSFVTNEIISTKKQMSKFEASREADDLDFPKYFPRTNEDSE